MLLVEGLGRRWWCWMGRMRRGRVLGSRKQQGRSRGRRRRRSAMGCMHCHLLLQPRPPQRRVQGQQQEHRVLEHRVLLGRGKE